MQFKTKLISGIFIKRYKRFFSDIMLDSGDVVVAHTANTGSMKNCTGDSWPVLLSYHDSPTRKLKYTLEMIHNGKSWIGINTSTTNTLAIEAIKNGTITELKGYTDLKPEAKIGESRIDILLSNGDENLCYVEVKNVTYIDEFQFCLFPDAVTERGLKHLKQLLELKQKGIRAVMLFVVQREDCHSFKITNTIDIQYCQMLRAVMKDGVEVLVYQCTLNDQEIKISTALPIVD